jgi:predicted Zn-dependent protease
MRIRTLVAAGTAVWLALATAPVPQAQEAPILVAMREEMQRAMAGLRLKDEPAPYYIAYTVTDAWNGGVISRLGSIDAQGSARARSLQVEVRVGDYPFDSSRFFDRTMNPFAQFIAGLAVVPLDDDPAVMRRQIWLATDGAYKRAVSTFSKKKAAFQNRSQTDPIPDFSRESPAETLLPSSVEPVDTKPWAEIVRKVTAAAATSPDIQTATASFNALVETRYFLNSEGFKVVAPNRSVWVSVDVQAQADDGMMVRDEFSVYGGTVADLPSEAGLIARAQALAGRVTALRVAPLGDDYSGPVLVEGQGAAALLAQTLVPLFLSQRAPDTDGPAMGTAPVSPFLTRIGSRVLPDSISVRDTPSLMRHDNAAVPGAFVVDEEGVKAKDVTLVEQGRLVTLLTSRTPQKGLLQSNGHARSGGAQAAVFQMQSARGMPAAELKAKYLELLKTQSKPFGYIVRGMSFVDQESPAARAGGGPRLGQAFKVTPDGKEQLVRGVRFGAIAHATYRDLLDVSADREMHSYRGAPAPGSIPLPGSGSAIVTVIVPSLLFEDLEVQRTKEVLQKPPVVPSPRKK